MTNTEARQRRLKIQMIGTCEEENQRTEQRVKTYFKKIFLKLKKKNKKLRLHFAKAKYVPENIN